jgi:rhodanese-related sulfurtransferase
MMKRNPLYTVLSLTALAFLPMGCATQDTLQPKEGWYKHLVGYEAVKPHAELPKDDNAALLVDSRPTAQRYDPGHIPLAINIPDTQFDKHVAKLPANKATPIIFYCQGLECDLSHKSAFKAEKLGYTNVKVYPAGLPGWEAKGELVAVSLAYVKKLIDEKTYFVLIDSRPEKVFGQGTIPGSINIPDTQFDKMAGRLPVDKEAKLIFYCGGLKCPLSSSSALKARALGYKNVFVFPAGYPAWQAMSPAPAATVAAPAAAMAQAASAMAGAMTSVVKTTSGIVIEGGKEKGSISLPSFERIIKAPPGEVLIVDVRDAKEFVKGTFPGAINIPINEIEKKLAELPKDKPVVFTCATGARSGEAYDTVSTLGSGIKAYFLDADVSCNNSNMCTIKGR